MSFEAVQWALAQNVGKSATKFVLVAMASHVNAEAQDWLCWPSYAAIGRITQQDTKTVEAAVFRLKELRFLVDTGQRKGETGKVIVYRLNDPVSGCITPRPQSADANGTRPQNTPENGVIGGSGNPPKFPANPPKFPGQSPQISGVTTPKTGDGTRNGTSNGTKKNKVVTAIAAIDGVPANLLADWLAVRKDKKAGTLTQTAVDCLLREAAKAGIAPEEGVRICIEANWINFNAGHYANRIAAAAPRQPRQNHTERQSEHLRALTNGRATPKEPHGTVIDLD